MKVPRLLQPAAAVLGIQRRQLGPRPPFPYAAVDLFQPVVGDNRQAVPAVDRLRGFIGAQKRAGVHRCERDIPEPLREPLELLLAVRADVAVDAALKDPGGIAFRLTVADEI